MNDLSNIKQTQQSYGIPTVGDLFRGKTEDIQDTISSIYYMLKQRVADIDFRQEIRQKQNRSESVNQEYMDQIAKLRTKQEQMQTESKDLQNQIRNSDIKYKVEREKNNAEKEELSKQIQRMMNKETQYKHDLRSKELIIQKIQDQLKIKLLEKGGKQQIGQMENLAPVLSNEAVKYSKNGGEGDFNLMIAKSQEEIYKKMSEENMKLKECLKQLQKELFDIVDLKTDIFKKRYRADYNDDNIDFESEDVIRHEIEKIREEVFNLPYEEAGVEITQKFQQNFAKLKEFMTKIDTEVASLGVFNQKEERSFDDPNNKFTGVSSVNQIKHLLKNYEALVEGQHTLLNQSITKMAKIPPPDEISSTFNRFSIIKDSELDEMRSFLNEHKLVMVQQYKDFEHEKKSFDDMNGRMESEKLKISEEREKIEAEVRKIRELNQQLSNQMQLSVK